MIKIIWQVISFLSKEESRLKIGLKNEKTIWIGTIAELHKNKGLDFAIEAYSQIALDFPNTIFVIIGEGEERKVLEKVIKDK